MRLSCMSEILHRMWIIVAVIIMLLTDDNAVGADNMFGLYRVLGDRFDINSISSNNPNFGQLGDAKVKAISSAEDPISYKFPEHSSSSSSVHTSADYRRNCPLCKYQYLREKLKPLSWDAAQPQRLQADKRFSNVRHKHQSKNYFNNGRRAKLSLGENRLPSHHRSYKNRARLDPTNSMMACPSNKTWVALTFAYNIEGVKVKVEQPSQRHAALQWFQVVTCVGGNYNRPADDPFSCIGVDRDRYVSRCDHKFTYVQALVHKLENGRWTDQTVFENIRIQSGCACEISALD